MNNPRIITGIYKNKKILVPDSARPYTDRVKKVIFDTLQDLVKGAFIADVFAGSGSVGLEALSREAKYVTFVETDSEAINIIRDNLKSFKVDKRKYNVYPDSFESFVGFSPNQYDLIFLDPPFPVGHDISMDNLVKVMHKDSIGILRIDSNRLDDFQMSEKFEVIQEKKIGVSHVFFFKIAQ